MTQQEEINDKDNAIGYNMSVRQVNSKSNIQRLYDIYVMDCSVVHYPDYNIYIFILPR